MPIADAVIPRAKSAAVGSFDGAFGSTPAHELEATACVGAVGAAEVRLIQVDEVILGTPTAGDALAIGHPDGARGAQALTMLLLEMAPRKVKKGLGTLRIGGGMGIAMTVER